MEKAFFVRELEAHSDMLYRVAFTILHSDDACRDALQDTALKAWEKRDTLREPRYFRTWVTRILINTCYDTRRKHSRIVYMQDVPERSSPPPDPTLAMALETLPDSLRLPLVLCCSEGMTYAEAAQALRLPISAIRGRIHRARLQLRKELEAE